MCGCLLHAPTGDLACNPGMCPDWESNQPPFGSQPMLNPLSYCDEKFDDGVIREPLIGDKSLLSSCF